MPSAARDKRKQMFEYVCRQHRHTGVFPSIREICKFMGFASTNTVAYHLRQMAEDGLIERNENHARSFSLSQSSLAAMSGIPLLGRVAAGAPILAEENFEGYVSVDSMFPLRSGNVFALTVQGESMIDAGIFDGDIVIVRTGMNIERGEIAVCIIDGEATVKRLYDDGKFWRLEPENAKLKPIIIAKSDCDFSVAGRVIGVIRSV